MKQFKRSPEVEQMFLKDKKLLLVYREEDGFFHPISSFSLDEVRFYEEDRYSCRCYDEQEDAPYMEWGTRETLLENLFEMTNTFEQKTGIPSLQVRDVVYLHEGEETIPFEVMDIGFNELKPFISNEGSLYKLQGLEGTRLCYGRRGMNFVTYKGNGIFSIEEISKEFIRDAIKGVHNNKIIMDRIRMQFLEISQITPESENFEEIIEKFLKGRPINTDDFSVADMLYLRKACR